MASNALDVDAQLVDGLPGAFVIQSHVRDSGDVDLSAIQLSDSGPQYLASFVSGPRFGELNDGVSHISKLGPAVLGPRLRQAPNRMDSVWTCADPLTWLR